MKAGDLALLAHIDDADVARALSAALTPKPPADLVDGQRCAELLYQHGNGQPLHSFAVRADGVELKALEQVSESLHTVYVYSNSARSVNWIREWHRR